MHSSISFLHHPATPALYTLSLHDALPICSQCWRARPVLPQRAATSSISASASRIDDVAALRSEEHTSELQSHSDLVCRLLLEKKKERMVIEYVEGWHNGRGAKGIDSLEGK